MKIYKFNSEFLAREFAARCNKAMRIFLGHDRIWVVTMAIGEKLNAMGYQEITII